MGNIHIKILEWVRNPAMKNETHMEDQNEPDWRANQIEEQTRLCKHLEWIK